MSQKQDTLAYARRLAKQLERQKRSNLRDRMRGATRFVVSDVSTGKTLRTVRYGDYDSPVTMSPSTEYNPFDKVETRKTIHDITQELQNDIQRGHVHKNSHSISHKRSEEKLLSHVVSDEVKDVWIAKLSLSHTLDDSSRAKLIQMSGSSTSSLASLRDARLSDLARLFIERWTETDGYDPDLHTHELQVKFAEYVRTHP